MTKSNELLSETLRDPKHSFRAANDRPKKALKHRYERRKARECIRLGSWVESD